MIKIKKHILILAILTVFPIWVSEAEDQMPPPLGSDVLTQEEYERMVEQKVAEIGGLAEPEQGPDDDVAAAFDAIKPSPDSELPPEWPPSAPVPPKKTEPKRYGTAEPAVLESREREQEEQALQEIDQMVTQFEAFEYDDAKGSDDTIYVHPEKKKHIDLSRIDVNRIHCEGDRTVVGFVYATDKGIEVSKNGANAFLRIVPEEWAFENPFELFVMCGEHGNSDLYRMIAYPKNLSTRNVILKDEGSRIQEAIDFFKGRSRDENIAAIVKAVWEENFEESWTIIPKAQKVAQRHGNYQITLFRTILTNADWIVDEYSIQNQGGPLAVKEEMFVGSNTVAVAVIDPVIETNQIGQVIVIRGNLTVN